MKHTQGELNRDERGCLLYKGGHPAAGGGTYLVSTFSGVPGSQTSDEAREQAEANAERIAALWNAANGMPTEEAVTALKVHAELKKMGGRTIANGVIENDVPLKEAVKYIEHGPEMVEALKGIQESFDLMKRNLPEGVCKSSVYGLFLGEDTRVNKILTKLEAK